MAAFPGAEPIQPLLALTFAGCVLLSVLVGSLVYEALTLAGRAERAPWYAMPVSVLCGALLLLLLILLTRG